MTSLPSQKAYFYFSFSYFYGYGYFCFDEDKRIMQPALTA